MNKKIVVAGATGFIGNRIVNELSRLGEKVIILSTHPQSAKRKFEKLVNIEFHEWRSRNKNYMEIAKVIDGSDAIINLSGINLAAKRWNEKFKKKILDSRIKSTHALVNAIKFTENKPEVLINSSAVGYYGFGEDKLITEDSKPGKDFLAELCHKWEETALQAKQYKTRVVMIRTGMVLDKFEGAFPQLVKPFKYFAGGVFGSGLQWMSWIHIDDIRDLFIECIYNKNYTEAVNGTSPNPVRNKEMAHAICKKIHRPCLFKIPGFALKIAVGEFGKYLITGQRVIPAKASINGFKFKYPDLHSAIENLL